MSKVQLVVTDVDNTLFDWVSYYATSFVALLHYVEKATGIPYDTLANESRDVFTSHNSIEYPFVIQEMPSINAHFAGDIDRMLREAVEPAREEFKRVGGDHLKPYHGVVETFEHIHRHHPNLPIVALTDAPCYVALWKLNKLKILHYFSAVYGLADPKLPTDSKAGRVKVNQTILIKHLSKNNFGFQGKIRVLPDEYEKPGIRGLKTVLMDYELDESEASRASVLWIGDNLRKDVGLGHRLGVKTVWASYGVELNPDMLKRLHEFSPVASVHKNASLPVGDPNLVQPDFTLKKFGDLESILA